MFKWFKKLFRRKPTGDLETVSIGGGIPEGMKIPEAVTTTNVEGEGYQQREPSEEYEVAMNKRKHEPGPDLVAIQRGQRRNKIHVYRQPFGYPIRLCDWVAQDRGDINVVHTRGQNMTLKQFISEHTRYLDNGRMCLHCWRVLLGDRTSVGMDNHGHGTGAPIC